MAGAPIASPNGWQCGESPIAFAVCPAAEWLSLLQVRPKHASPRAERGPDEEGHKRGRVAPSGGLDMQVEDYRILARSVVRGYVHLAMIGFISL